MRTAASPSGGDDLLDDDYHDSSAVRVGTRTQPQSLIPVGLLETPSTTAVYVPASTNPATVEPLPRPSVLMEKVRTVLPDALSTCPGKSSAFGPNASTETRTVQWPVPVTPSFVNATGGSDWHKGG